LPTVARAIKNSLQIEPFALLAMSLMIASAGKVALNDSHTQGEWKQLAETICAS